MKPDSRLGESRVRLATFLEPILARLGREERRRWGAFWIRGLLMEGGRKTAAGIANRYGAEVQALQQFVNQSPWDWRPVREALVKLSVSMLSPVCGWVIDDTGFPKKGTHSVGVARHYSGTLGTARSV
jgi:SRSO17 transposase